MRLLLLLLLLLLLHGAEALKKRCVCEYESEYESTPMPTYEPSAKPSWMPTRYIARPTKAPHVLPNTKNCRGVCRSRLTKKAAYKPKNHTPPGCVGSTGFANCVCGLGWSPPQGRWICHPVG